MNVRNPKYNSYGSVECEIEHPVYGWIPFHAVAGDPESDKVLARIAADALPIAAATPIPLPAVKAQKLAELLKAREAAEQANVTVQGKVFSADPKIADKFEKLASRLRRGKTTKLAAILTVDGTPVQATQQLLEQIEDAIADQMETVWNKYGTLVAQVNAATTVAQVHAVVW